MSISVAWLILLAIVNLLLAPRPGNWWGIVIAILVFIVLLVQAVRAAYFE